MNVKSCLCAEDTCDVLLGKQFFKNSVFFMILALIINNQAGYSLSNLYVPVNLSGKLPYESLS